MRHQIFAESGQGEGTGLLEKDIKPREKAPYSRVVRFGLWVTVVAAALWAGGRLINRIDVYLPFVLGLGIAIMALGLMLEYRAKNRPDRSEP